MDKLTKILAKVAFGYLCIWIASYGIILKNLLWVILGISSWTLVCCTMLGLLYKLYDWFDR